MTSNTIQKLNVSNYAVWSSDVKYLMLDKGVWDIIDKKLEIPKLSTTVTQANIDAFMVRRNQALSLIYLNIEPEFKRIVDDCGDDPVVAWKRLRDNFHPDTRAHHMALFSELVNERIKTSESINLFATRLKKIYLNIKAIDKDFSEKYLSYQLLRYLSSCYDSCVQSLLRKDDASFKFDLIVTELVAEEARLKL